MKNLLKQTSVALATGAAYLATSIPAFAVDIDPCPRGTTNGTNFSGLCNLSANNIGNVISGVITILLIAAAIIALFFLIWGGIKWITSGGDKAKVTEARQTIVASIIGLIVALLAFFIITLVLGLFGLSLTNLKLPNLI